MQRDCALLCDLASNPNTIIHHYDWPCECVTYGHFIDPSLLLDLKKAKLQGIEMARRPTGGGLLFHGSDLAFSVLLPAGHPLLSSNTLENYALINGVVLSAVRRFLQELHYNIPAEHSPCTSGHSSYCMAHPTCYDLLIGGRKVAGSAQRRTRNGLLHQGSIFLASPSQMMADLLLDQDVFAVMQQVSGLLLEAHKSKHEVQKLRDRLRELLTECLQELLNF